MIVEKNEAIIWVLQTKTVTVDFLVFRLNAVSQHWYISEFSYVYQNDGVLRMNMMVNRVPFTKMERFVTHYYGVLATPKLSLSSEMHAPKFSYDARFNIRNTNMEKNVQIRKMKREPRPFSTMLSGLDRYRNWIPLSWRYPGGESGRS